ncbi:BREX protein BrxB domain-containing protein [Mycolicibacterium monacense]|uniref:BREX protein BrxB domain-containing protein n=1 Tax=Mycolicibacterium monacense TaxID=85693 RepID=UPI0007E98790|nr:BREX protein BrxB domain-containing protein [Mycolicibacterium monacense]OBF48783.1 hypothetical protein A5778_22440 [Mycolicibacterium monacense]
MPLHKSIHDIGNGIADYFARPGGDGPYRVYVYRPKDEYRVRRDLQDLNTWLGAQGIVCCSISLADLFWKAIEDSGWEDALVSAELDAPSGDPSALLDVIDSIGAILRQEPTLTDRVVAELVGVPDRTAVFLYRAGALYPALRTSSLLDELQGLINFPVTLLYPGRLYGDYGLSFMDKLEPAFGYRAAIIERKEGE